MKTGSTRARRSRSCPGRRWHAAWRYRRVTWRHSSGWARDTCRPPPARRPSADYFRWQLGWGLTDLQAVSLAGLGLVGAVAWTRGTIKGAIAGFRRVLAAEGGHLVAVAAMAAVATGVGAAAAYAVVLLLPVQSWVLAAADGYAHFATLPVGLWTLAALIELAQRSLPVASLVAAHESSCTRGTRWRQRTGTTPYPHVATPTS